MRGVQIVSARAALVTSDARLVRDGRESTAASAADHSSQSAFGSQSCEQCRPEEHLFESSADRSRSWRATAPRTDVATEVSDPPRGL